MSAGVEVLVEHVVKTFGSVRALRDVSLSVGAGEFLTISGPSGSGKTTLLSLIGALERPDEGRVIVGGEAVPDPGDAVEFRRHTVGFVFQDDLLLPYLSARGNVETPLMATRAGRHERQERASELLSEVGLDGRASHVPAELSGGERQRVAVARALANRPRLLLADEPTGALDAADSRRVLDLFGTLRDRFGMTLIVVSHDPVVSDRADRAERLEDGKLVRREPEPRPSATA
jgi:putative ABC transport system ATP-binding protein